MTNAIEERNADFAEAMDAVNKSLQLLNNTVSEYGKMNKSLDKRVDILEKQVAITRLQANNIKSRVRKLARELVGYPSDLYGVTIQDIYRYLRNYYNLSMAVADTERQYYDDVVHGLGTYEKNCFDRKRLEEHRKKLDESK